jgi:uncharacterized protein with HEPN domain
MNTNKVRVRLGDILLAIQRLELIVVGLDFETFNLSFEKQWLVDRGVEIVSEASRHIPDEMCAAYPAVSWKDIKSIGNRLRHEYNKVDPFIMWTIAIKHMPQLKPVIVDMLATLDASSKT